MINNKIIIEYDSCKSFLQLNTNDKGVLAAQLELIDLISYLEQIHSIEEIKLYIECNESQKERSKWDHWIVDLASWYYVEIKVSKGEPTKVTLYRISV